MQQHKQHILSDGVERIQIMRESLWNESVGVFKNPSFKVKCTPRVKFEGESGIDGGGLSREYGSILQQKIFSTEANLFEGSEEHKLPIYSVEAIYSRLFQVVGKMVAYLIVHLDIGIPCLSQAVYQFIVSGSIETAAPYCTLEDISDYGIKELIIQVINYLAAFETLCCMC